ncbi:FAD-dependent oxidoreductase [Synechococcus sp. CS-1325]|uniref:NAD(P)/FAD-dependent oxidoreductase n=1 Tax=Synechococcus sp. CS-1325 TaxID=2847979 RepID=UPI000DB2C296|nr:FAD-dependent oxidoreductase [Synechococcus sp. CS-1325]MCT0200463.1 FAD-dependent oxidoreductase [Synechococcus sp. CS-1325]PZV02516.1 MAG: FAD-dependent oxidoreductase [Cyanobium sp.]
MFRLSELKVPLDHSDAELRQAVLDRLGISAEALLALRVVKRSVDARRRSAVQFSYSLDLDLALSPGTRRRLGRDPQFRPSPDATYRFVGRAAECPDGRPRPIVIGAGPCGYFAALLLAQMGFKPLLLERGKAVKERSADTFGFWRDQRPFDPESNVQFGEGGAGTFSDGKLYSQIRDPQHHGRKVLEELVACGANPDILHLHRPHIGTFKLATVVRGLRARIEALGGEIRFQSRVVRLETIPAKAGPLTTLPPAGRSGAVSAGIGDDRFPAQQMAAVWLADGSRLAADQVVLAVGHSARDTFAMLLEQGVAIEAKPFSIGLRIEHPQSLIDQARWGAFAGHPRLGAAEYKLVHHCANGRSVYSFCMCPGGLVVAAASEPGHLVTNGMSQHSRNERNANSGIVVGLQLADLEPFGQGANDPLAGIAFQRHWEAKAFALGGRSYRAPCQRVGDFLQGSQTSTSTSTTIGTGSTGLAEMGEAADLIQPSYGPGVNQADLGACLPAFAAAAIREALPAFDRTIPGFSMATALLTGVETRTSSPVRIPRGENLQSINVRGLYPAGEGAGYAGGILSAAIDGIKVAEALALTRLRRQRREESGESACVPT